MKALWVLYSLLYRELPHLHLARLKALEAVVAAALSLPLLSVTWIDRAIQGTAKMKHRIKRSDRLIGNPNLSVERPAVYGALARFLLLKVLPEPVILIDWSDLPHTDDWKILRASLPVKGRGLTLYEEVHPQSRYGHRRVQNRFFEELKAILPLGSKAILIGDAGFRVPFYRRAGKLGFDWIGRIMGRDYICFRDEGGVEWQPASGLHAQATTRAKRLGSVFWVRSNPLAADLVLYKGPSKGRQMKTRKGTKAKSRHSRKNAKRE